MDFKTYLASRKISANTIETYKRYKSCFLDWLNKNGREPEEVTYDDLIRFIKDCKDDGQRIRYIGQRLGVVRHYYEYLKQIGKVTYNPAASLYLKKRPVRVPENLLNAERLEAFYTDYKKEKGTGIGHLSKKRNRVIMGLIVFQALNTQEIQLLEKVHIRLTEGKIDVPGTKRSNRRTLQLEAQQIVELQEYVMQTRELILALTEKKTDKLFVSTGSAYTLHAALEKMMNGLKKKHEDFDHAAQLRQSRIAIWIKQYGIRRAQYMAGHRYVRSTERYETRKLDELQKLLNQKHPLK